MMNGYLVKLNERLRTSPPEGLTIAAPIWNSAMAELMRSNDILPSGITAVQISQMEAILLSEQVTNYLVKQVTKKLKGQNAARW